MFFFLGGGGGVSKGYKIVRIRKDSSRINGSSSGGVPPCKTEGLDIDYCYGILRLLCFRN